VNGNNFKRLIFTDFHDQIFVNMYFSKNGITPIVQQKNCLLRDTIQAVCDQLFGKNTNETTNDVKRLKYIVGDKIAQSRVEQHIFSLPFSIREIEKNCIYRAKISKNGQTVFIRQFSNGTLTIDGREPLFSEINNQLQTVLGFSALPAANEMKLEKQIEAVMSVDLGSQWIGTDEAGKGDYFGPLVGAAVFVNHSIADKLERMGVKDSKKISDKRNRELAGNIMTLCGQRARVVLVPPARYNQLYEQFKIEKKNLNTLLAWIHTRALEDILSRFPQDQVTVIIDKFADEQYIKSKLLENARRTNLNLVQLPKAEANIAVAAASILARAQFLNWLERTSQELKMSLPKGSSDPKIAEIARLIIQKSGQEKLAEVAKLHFKTTENVLSSQ
jgi:ribonuclease HIII